MPCSEGVRVFVRRRITACLEIVSHVVTDLWWVGRSFGSMEQRVVLHLTFAAKRTLKRNLSKSNQDGDN